MPRLAVHVQCQHAQHGKAYGFKLVGSFDARQMRTAGHDQFAFLGVREVGQRLVDWQPLGTLDFSTIDLDVDAGRVAYEPSEAARPSRSWTYCNNSAATSPSIVHK